MDEDRLEPKCLQIASPRPCSSCVVVVVPGVVVVAVVAVTVVAVVAVVVVVEKKSSFSPYHGWCYSQTRDSTRVLGV